MTSAPPPTPPPAPPADPPGWQQPPPPPPGPPARPQLRRSRTDKVIGGVSGGLAEYSGIDALLFRIGFVALAFAGGTGILVYLLLWLLMPAGPYGPPDNVSQPGRAGASTRSAGPRSPVPGITMAGLLIVIGVLVLLTRFTDWNFGVRGFLGAALLVVGLGLVVSAFSGGRTARGGLITLGVLLSLALIFVSSLPWAGVRAGIGDRTFHPDTAREVRATYNGGIGDMTLDLTDVDLSGLDGPIVTRVDAGIGDVDILVPRSADVEVEVHSGIGTVDVLGERNTDGGYYRGSGNRSWTGDDEPEIVISIHSGIGDVEVDRG